MPVVSLTLDQGWESLEVTQNAMSKSLLEIMVLQWAWKSWAKIHGCWTQVIFVLCRFICLFCVWGPYLVDLKVSSWLYTQKSLLEGSGDHMGCQGWTQVSHVQIKYPTCCTIAPSPWELFLSPVIQFPCDAPAIVWEDSNIHNNYIDRIKYGCFYHGKSYRYWYNQIINKWREWVISPGS